MGKKLLWKVLPMAFLAGVGSTAFTSCADEYDPANITREDILKENYAKNWEEVFGTPDPNQDWSMAATVVANIAYGGNITTEIYSDKPGYPNSRLVSITNGMLAKFNIVKGSEQVYAIVKENGKKLVSGFFNVVNGVVSIDGNPVNRKRAVTRAEGDLEHAETPSFVHTSYAANTQWDEKTYIVDPHNGKHLFYIKKEGDDWFLYYAPTENSPFRKLAHNAIDPDNNICGYHNNTSAAYYADGDQEEAYSTYWPNLITKNTNGELTFVSTITKYETRAHYDANYYTISDTKTTNVEWKIGECKELFWLGDKSFFAEGTDYRSTAKRKLYESQGVSLEDMEEGVIYTTSKDNDQINVPMMFGCTANNNILGYYYYKEGATPEETELAKLTANRYILYEDASPAGNIKVDGTAVGGMTLQQMPQGATDESIVTCTNRRLVYFGLDGNSAGTYDFPKGVKIGFFIRRKTTPYTNYYNECWAYSDPALNKKYFTGPKGEDYSNNWAYQNSVSGYDTTRGRVKALTWALNGRILVGFGDEGGDKDLNDFVFWVDGEFEETPKINITTKTSAISWVFACEDLGGSFDYDFNDVVWEVSQEYKIVKETGKPDVTKYGDLRIALLAAGGTLPVHLLYDDNDLGEVHEAFGQSSASSYSAVNVNSNTVEKQPVVLKRIAMTESSDAIDINTLKNKFKIQVESSAGTRYFVTMPKNVTDAEKKDATPQILLLPEGWDWPTEETPITEVYPAFKEWAQDVNMTTWTLAEGADFVVNPHGDTVVEDDETPDPEDTREFADFSVTYNNTDLCTNGLTMTVGDVLHSYNGLAVSINNNKGDTNAFTIVSSNNDVVLFDGNVHNWSLTAKSAGTAIITVKHAAGTYKETIKTFTVTVNGAGGSDSGSGDAGTATLTLGGSTLTTSDYSYSNGVYTVNASNFSTATKITVSLTTATSGKQMNACVYADNYTDSKGVSYNAKSAENVTIVIEDDTVIANIKNSGLKITDWTVQYPNEYQGNVGSIAITVE